METVKATVAGPEHFTAYLQNLEPVLKQEDIKLLQEKFQRIVWWARRHGSTMTAVPAAGVGQVQIQSEGSRLVAIMGLDDMAVFGETAEDSSCGVCVWAWEYMCL